MNTISDHLKFLGFRVKDCVTGFEGVVSTVAFDLYGCIQAIVSPGVDEKGELRESKWFDLNRLQIMSEEPVLKRPTFEITQQVILEGKKGPAERPNFYKS